MANFIEFSIDYSYPDSKAEWIKIITNPNYTNVRIKWDCKCPAETLSRMLTDILESLKSNQTVKRLEFTSIDFSEMLLETLIDLLKTNTTISDLDLAFATFKGTQFPKEQFEKLVNALRSNTAIEQLSLEGIELSDIAHPALKTLLKNNPTLRYLNLEQTTLLDEDVISLAAGLQENHTLETLSLLCQLEVWEKGTKALGQALKENSSLQSLILHKVLIGNDLAALTSGIALNTGLYHLDLSYSGLSEKSVPALADMLTHNRHLVKLNLRGNELKNIAPIIFALKNNQCLTHLKLDENPLIEKDIVELAYLLTANQHLSHLYLNEIILTTQGAVQLGRALVRNRGLSCLFMNAANAGEEGITSIIGALIYNTGLMVLSLGKAFIRDAHSIVLTHAIVHNRTLTCLDLRDATLSSKVKTLLTNLNSCFPTLDCRILQNHNTILDAQQIAWIKLLGDKVNTIKYDKKNNEFSPLALAPIDYCIIKGREKIFSLMVTLVINDEVTLDADYIINLRVREIYQALLKGWQKNFLRNAYIAKSAPVSSTIPTSKVTEIPSDIWEYIGTYLQPEDIRGQRPYKSLTKPLETYRKKILGESVSTSTLGK